MRKNYLSVIVLIVVLFVGCDKGKILYVKAESDMTLLKMERCLEMATNPSITILAKKIFFDYKQRMLFIEGLKNIAGKNGGDIDWVIPEINIRDNNLIINIPTDSDYNVKIGDNCFYIPFIEK